MLTLEPVPRRRAARAARRATPHERASAVLGSAAVDGAACVNSGWASRRRLNFGWRLVASRVGASRNARPRRRQTIQLGCPDGVVGLHSYGATFQTVRSSSRRRGEALHPPQSRPSAEPRSTRYSRFVVFFHTVALTRAACRATRQWWSILLCGTLLEACLALGPQIRRGKVRKPVFNLYKKRDKRASCQRL